MSKDNNNGDVEMKDATISSDKKEEIKKEEPYDPFFGMLYDCLNLCLEFKKTMVLLEKSGKDKDSRLASSLTK